MYRPLGSKTLRPTKPATLRIYKFELIENMKTVQKKAEGENHHHHFVEGQCIVCKLPTTSTEWAKEIADPFYDEGDPRPYEQLVFNINKALTTRTDELLGAMKMEKKQLHSVGGGDIGGYIDVPDDAYNRRVEIYNKAVDEFNEKLATLREKYSV